MCACVRLLRIMEIEQLTWRRVNSMCLSVTVCFHALSDLQVSMCVLQQGYLLLQYLRSLNTAFANSIIVTIDHD
jgi:hypothetical protein